MKDPRLYDLKHNAGIKKIKGGKGIPLYVQIYDGVQRCLDNSRWEKGERFGSFQELAELFDVSRLTVKHAIKPFIDRGVLKSTRGRGLYVNCDHSEKTSQEEPQMVLTTDWRSYSKCAHSPEVAVLKSERRMKCPWDIPEPCVNQTPSPFHYMLRVHAKNGEPQGVIEAYFDAEIFEMSPRLFSEDTILLTIEKIKPDLIASIYQKITVKRADSSVANLLKIPTGDPIGLSRRIAVDKNGKLIYIALSHYPGDKVQIDIAVDCGSYES